MVDGRLVVVVEVVVVVDVLLDVNRSGAGVSVG